MYVISNKAWREAVELLKAYAATKCSTDDLKAVNARRRAKVLVTQLTRAKQL